MTRSSQPARPEVPLSPARSAELLALLCAANVVMVANLGMLGPLLLQLSAELDVPIAQAGLLASATALPWAIGAPTLGPLSDRFGRRPMLTASLTGLGLATLVGAFVGSFGLLLAVRLASGFLASPGPTSVIAAVGDEFPPARRASALGWVNSGFGFAALVGVPAIGAIAGVFGWRSAFLAVGITTISLAALVWSRLPRRVRQIPPGGSLAVYRQVLRSRGLGLLLGANVLERSVYATSGLYLAAFLMQTYGLELLEVAPLLGLLAIGAVVGNVVGGRLADRLLKPGVFGGGQVAAAGLATALFGLTPGLAGSVALGAAFGLATSMSRPAIMAMVSGVSSEHRGTAIGIFSFTNQAGWAAGPAVMGLAFSFGGYPALALLCGLASAGAALLIVPLAKRGW